MTGRIIRNQDDLYEGLKYLSIVEPRFAAIIPDLAPLPLRLKPEGFAPVLSAIIGQQVSTASAEAVWLKMQAAGLHEAAGVRRASETDLRACGLSRQKIRYAYALAEADIDYVALRDLPDADVIRTLTAVTGVGLWTAEIYLMFSLGRADSFAAGDLAILIAAQDIFGLPARPTDTQMRQIAAPWSPWRSVAARLLWSYYLITKQRDGIR